MVKVRQDSLSPTSWLIKQVDILHCHRLSKVLVISLLHTTLWYDRCDTRKLVFISQCRSNTRLNDDESQCDEDETTDFKGTSGNHINFLTAFLHTAGMCLVQAWLHMNQHTRRETHSYTQKANSRQANRHTSIQTFINLFPFSTIFSFSILLFLCLSLLLSHTNTQPHRWVIECDSKSSESCWRVIRLTCEM